MTPREWRAVHISYYQEDRDALILGAVRPLLARVAPDVDTAYFVRHWRRGPHLRVVFEATTEAFREVVEPAVEELVGEYLRRCPSAGPVPSEAELLPVHRKLAESEAEQGSLTPFYPDNAISWAAHDRRTEVLGSETAADELAAFYTRTNELVFTHLAAVAAGQNRELLALRLMLATAHTLCRHPDDPTVRRGFISFRSHADGFLSTVDPSVRTAFDQRFAANRELLIAQVHAVVDTFDRAGESTGGAGESDAAGGLPLVREWVAALDPLGQRWTELAAAGLIPPPEIPDRADGSFDELLERSPFHRAIVGNHAYWELMFRDQRFQRYRLMLNYTYLHLARLGIPGLGRYLLCHLAARAVEQAYGVDAEQTVLAFVAAHPNTPSGTVSR
ncbi:thiopeptide maturation pyridine synthase [Kitasatospora sp. NBC_01266]|uniref:thiopeptide maturation pyridine synthase n=1 Tax=Kitasatospora sp. NBC_01266 TaxID=2903572 RepID=UPI002E3675F2|nr:thiopeptide maturation pyridine synthase [Kitasatospora sp. NBC_01266]